MILGLAARRARLPSALAAGAAPGRAWLHSLRPALAAERVAHGFSSPGNSGMSEEMKEVGRPEDVKFNEEDQALSERSAETAEGQTHGVIHQSPETPMHAREPGPGEYVDTRPRPGQEPEPKSVEEAAAVGEGVLPGSRQGMAPPQGRSYHTSARVLAAGGERGEGQSAGAEAGIDPGVEVFPKSSGDDDFDPVVTPKPDTPDEEAAAHEAEPTGVPQMAGGGEGWESGATAAHALEWEGYDQKGSSRGYHTWVGAAYRRGLRTHVGVVRAVGKGGEASSGEPTGREGGPGFSYGSSVADEQQRGGSSSDTPSGMADKGGQMPPNVGKESSASERSAEEPESSGAEDPDEVMQKRLEDPSVGGYAT